MMECGEENYPNNPNSCWRAPGLPDDLEANDIETYNIPQGDQGPRDRKDPRDVEKAQCVELALRWQFCVYSSICHEIYF